jgi:hypothetical protein
MQLPVDEYTMASRLQRDGVSRQGSKCFHDAQATPMQLQSHRRRQALTLAGMRRPINGHTTDRRIAVVRQDGYRTTLTRRMRLPHDAMQRMRNEWRFPVPC